MKLNPAQLNKHLQGSLTPIYVVSGDEALLCQEACDAIRAATRQQGFGERQVFNAENNFDWGQLLQAGASLSLFAEKRLLELRIPNGKPGDKGAAALLEYLARPAEDTVLLISLPKLDGSTQKTKWAKALIDGAQTQFLQIWPVDAAQLPQWIRQRLAQAGLSASQEAVEMIAARVEGNLLAAAQEIEKLKLLAEGGQVDADTVLAAVADSARYDVFGLIDAALAGEAAHALRMLEGLRGEGVEPPVILWALAREIRLLATIAEALSDDGVLLFVEPARLHGSMGRAQRAVAGPVGVTTGWRADRDIPARIRSAAMTVTDIDRVRVRTVQWWISSLVVGSARRARAAAVPTDV